MTKTNLSVLWLKESKNKNVNPHVYAEWESRNFAASLSYHSGPSCPIPQNRVTEKVEMELLESTHLHHDPLHGFIEP